MGAFHMQPQAELRHHHRKFGIQTSERRQLARALEAIGKNRVAIEAALAELAKTSTTVALDDALRLLAYGPNGEFKVAP